MRGIEHRRRLASFEALPSPGDARVSGVQAPRGRRIPRLAAAGGLAGLLLTLALAALAPSPAARAQDGRRHVDDDPGCAGASPCHASIQAAVDAAAEGEIIAIAPGVYTETVLLVDKALTFEGPGAAMAQGPDDPATQAIWVGQSGGLRGAALTVDARSRDIDGLAVRGLRFRSAGLGILLHGRRAGDPLGAWPGLPATAPELATTLRGTRISGNRFNDIGGGGLPEAAALVSFLAEDLGFAANLVTESAGGLVARAGQGLSASDNRIEGAGGPGIELSGIGGLVSLRANTILEPAGRGIDIDDPSAGLAAVNGVLEIVDNRVEASGAEALRLRAGPLRRFGRVLVGDNVFLGAGRGALALEAAVGILAQGGELRGLVIEGGRIEGPDVAGAAGLSIVGVTSTLELRALAIAGAAGPGLRLVDARDAWLHRSLISGCGEALRIVETSASDPAQPFDLRLGGSPGEGNRFVDNRLGLRLEKSGAGASHDVDARYNDWGLAWAPQIEALIQHRPDDGRLGSVSFMPALGMPATVLLDADPPLLEADGRGTSRISARVLDVLGRPAADGALLSFGTNGGSLDRPGTQVEVEDPLQVERSGAWERLDDARYGLPSSLAYLRAIEVGAALSMTFDASALVLRYGQSPVDPGRFRVRVDGLALGDFEARGARREWVELPLASALGPGRHVLQLELLYGELALDRILAGESLEGGLASATLLAADAPGRAKLRAEAYGATGMVAAGLEVPFVSGPPASMTLELEAETLAVGGASTRVTARLHDGAGRPVRDGTLLRFSAQGGSVSPLQAATRSGLAEASFTSGRVAGQAVVIAAADGLTISREITLQAAAPASLIVTATRSQLPANSVASAALELQLRDAFGNAVADGTPILLSSSLGRLESDRVSTLGGRSSARLVAGNLAGEALVQAAAGVALGATRVRLVPTELRLTKTAEPRSVVVPGERVTYSLRVENPGSGAVYELDLLDRLPAGLISPSFRADFRPRGPQLENRSGADLYAFRIDRLLPGQLGLITLTAHVDSRRIWGAQSRVLNRASVGSALAAEASPDTNLAEAELLVSPGAAYTVTVEAPARLTVGGERGELVVRVQDRLGNPAADGTAVFLTSDEPSMARIEPMVTSTRAGIARASLITGLRAGETTVRALSLEERGGSARVRVAPGPAEALDLASSRQAIQIGGATTALTATLRDRYGNGVPEAALRFNTDAGLLGLTQARSDARGVATSSLRSGIRVGPARVRVTHLDLGAERQIDFLPGDPASLMLELASRSVAVGGRVLAQSRVEDAFGNPVPGLTVVFDSDIGRPRQRSSPTDPIGVAQTEIDAPRVGSGFVSAQRGSLRAEKRLDVRPARLWLPLLIER